METKNSMSKTFEDQMAKEQARREAKSRMHRVKITITPNRAVVRMYFEKKIYFRDEADARAAMKKYETMLDKAMNGEIKTINIEGQRMKAEAVAAFKVKYRAPKIDTRELPRKIDDEDDDD